MNEITGKIKLINDTNTFPSGFRKREFVVTTPGDYPQDIKLEFYQDDCSKLDSFSNGDEVTVSYNLKGNEYQGKYYVNLQAWKITSEASTQKNPKAQASSPVQVEETEESSKDLTENISELADAPF